MLSVIEECLRFIKKRIKTVLHFKIDCHFEVQTDVGQSTGTSDFSAMNLTGRISADCMQYRTTPTSQCYGLQKEPRIFFWTR